MSEPPTDIPEDTVALRNYRRRLVVEHLSVAIRDLAAVNTTATTNLALNVLREVNQTLKTHLPELKE